MKIHFVFIEKYKQLQNFRLSFESPSPLLSQVSIKFLIGRNGAGKSSLMEAIGLILSRTMMGSEPGFGFELVYSLQTWEDDEVFVDVRTVERGGERLVEVREGASIEEARRAEAHREPFRMLYRLHPSRIFSTAAGPTNTMDKSLIDAPLSALKQEFYNEARDPGPDKSRLDRIESEMEALLYDPKFLFFDSTNAKLILLALCATRPEESKGKMAYNKLRRVLFSVLPSFTPVAITLVIDESRIQELRRLARYRKYRTLERFARLIDEQEHAYDFMLNGVTFQQDGASPTANRKITYRLEAEEGEKHFRYSCSSLHERFEPIGFLVTLLAAKQAGYLKDAHLFFKHGNSPELLDEDSLSDGEYMWLTRIGLILLARGESVRNSLFLMDEPDVFLNESWTSKFVRMIHLMMREEYVEKGEQVSYLPQEFFIATHSSLILTDALMEQTYFLFKKSEQSDLENDDKPTPHVVIKAEGGAFHTFGADRGEITEHLFAQNNRVGSYAQRQVALAIGPKFERDKIENLIRQVGPGFLHFQLQDYYYANIEGGLTREED